MHEYCLFHRQNLISTLFLLKHRCFLAQKMWYFKQEPGPRLCGWLEWPIEQRWDSLIIGYSSLIMDHVKLRALYKRTQVPCLAHLIDATKCILFKLRDIRNRISMCFQFDPFHSDSRVHLQIGYFLYICFRRQDIVESFFELVNTNKDYLDGVFSDKRSIVTRIIESYYKYFIYNTNDFSIIRFRKISCCHITLSIKT